MSSIREMLASVLGGSGGAAAASTSIRPQEVAADLANLQLIDVREADEWKSGHVDGAVPIPLGRLQESLGSIDPSRRVAVICHSGMRSQQGAQLLRKYSLDAVSVSGGMSAWTRAGLPVARGAGNKKSR
ncbi:MAG: hypothetical protein NVS3B24_22030 [Candidatus Dormibacteria bacterium]